MLSHTNDAYVFSKSNGLIFFEEGETNRFSARYHQGIYTYQLNSNLYFCFYVVQDGNYYYSGIGAKTIKDVVTTMRDKVTDSYERAVYVDMLALFDSITSYREDYFSKN